MNTSQILFLYFIIFYLFSLSTIQAQDKDYEIAYKQAIKYFDSNKSKEGFEYLNRAIGINPSYYDALYARSYYLMQENEYEKAFKDYNLLIKLYPNNPSLHLYRAQAKFALERYEDAEDDYLTAYELDSTDIEITNGLGSFYFLMDLYEDAKIFLDKSIELSSQDSYAFYYRAYTFYYLKKYDLALQDVDVCLKMDVNDIDAQRLKSMILIAQKKYKEAIVIYETLQKKNIDFEVEDFYYWGFAYFQQKKFNDAQFYFELPEKPENPELYYYLGKTKFLLNNPKDALKKLDSAIVLYSKENEESAKVFYDRAIVKHKLRDLKGAESDFFESLFLMPEIIEQKSVTGEILDLLGNCFELLQIDKKKTNLDSIRIKGFQSRAEALIANGDTNQAIIIINKALSIDSLDSFSYTIRGTALAMLGKYKQAMEDLDKGLKLSKNKSLERIYYVKGLIYTEMGSLLDAKDFLQKAIQLNSQQSSYFADLANVFYNLGDFNAAIAQINTAIKLNPSTSEYYIDRANYLIANKEFEKAIEDCDKALKADKENAFAYYNRGLASIGLLKYSQAIEDFTKVLEYYPDDEEVNQLLKEAMSKMENEKKK